MWLFLCLQHTFGMWFHVQSWHHLLLDFLCPIPSISFSFPCFFPSSHSCLMSGCISWDVLLTQSRRDLPMVLLPLLLALGVELAHGRCCHNGRMWWRRTCNSGAGRSHLVVVRCFLLAPCILVCLHQMQQPQVPQCILCTLYSNSFAKTKFQFQ